MGFYEAAKDALKLAQKADNIELVQKIMDIQSEALEMQHQVQQKNEEILVLKDKLRSIKDKKKYTYEEGHKWLIDPAQPSLKICATCMNRNSFESPLSDIYDDVYLYCGNCKNSVN